MASTDKEKTRYETGFSRVTGEWFVTSHDGLEFVGGYSTHEQAEKQLHKMEENEDHRVSGTS